MASQKNVRTAHSLPERKRTSDVLSSENINVDFASLLLSEPVQKGLTAAGFEKPSPIQLKAIPLGRCGLDLIVQAKSGTGKTCVFSVIALESIITTSSSLQVLVLAPTREIAVQIQNVIQAIGIAMEGLKCHTFIGGTIFGQDRQHLKKCHIAVGTPGRIKQLIEYEVLKTESIRMFVLDEADKLLDEKFQASVNWIYHQLPENKQMLALSATYPESLAQQLTNYMRDPTFVRLNPRDLTLQGIKQFYMVVPGHQLPHKSFQIKADHLVTLLSQIAFNQCLIFSNFQSRAHNLCELLLEKGWPATYISGNQEQVDRMKAMAELKTYKCRILISTDLTSRGIDAENVNLIINLDVPVDFKTYLHRIGRAGRFGTHGAAITLASEGQEVNLLKTVKKRSGSDIRLLPDPVPSNLLEMSVAKVQAEILDPLDVNEPAEMEIVEDQDTSQSQRKENSGQMLELEDSTKEQICYPQMEKDGDVDGEVNGNMAVNGYPPVEKVYHVSPEKQTQVSFGNKNGASTSETKHYESEEKLLEGKVRRDLQNGIGRMVEAGGDQFQIRRSSSHRWMVNLDEWVLPIMVMQEVRKTTRKRWTWEEAFREFENKRQSYKNEKVTLDSEEGNSQLQNGDAPFRDDSFEVGSKEDGVKGLGASDGTKKGSQRDTFSKTDDNSDHGDELNVAGTEKMLEKSDVYVEFQAMRALLKQCKTEMVALKGVDLIPRLARQVRLRNDKVKSQKEMVLETKGPNAGYKNLPRGRTKGGDFEKQEVSMDFKLEEEEAQIERPKAGGEGRIVGRQSERTSGIDDKISGVIGETSGVYDVSRVGRTFGTLDDEQMSKSNAYPQENRLDGQDSCEMELNLNERKLKNSPEESQTNPTGELCYDEHFKRNRPSVKFEQIGDGETIGATKDSDWTHGAGCHSNLSKENTSDKIWEYFKQYLKEESKTSLPSQRLGKMNEEINDSESVNHCRSDSDGFSSLSKSERSVESEQRLLDYKTSDLSTGSLKLNDFDSFKKSDGEKKLPRKGKTRKNSKGQDVSLDASYGYYPSHGGWEWNEGALGDESYGDGWDSNVYPSNNLWWGHGETGWSHGYEESVYPHSYWGSYYNNY